MNILRLAYHGIRAKDKTVQCQTLVTEFDQNLGKSVSLPGYRKGYIEPINNAFYAVAEKKN